MITNLPTEKDFEEVTFQCLTQAFNLLFKVYQDYQDYDETVQEEVEMSRIWEHNDGTIRTSVILLHQAVETFMKSVVCNTSPLLLIEKNRADWPTLPKKSDKDFDSLYTISGESLLATFCAVESSIEINDKLIIFIEKIRQNRNKAIHGASKISIKPTDLLEDILKTFTYFFGKDSWFLHLSNFNFKNPLFGYFDWDFEDAMSYEFLDFAEFMIGKKRLNKFHSIDLTGRRYFCKICKDTIDAEYGHLESKWAFLKPNKPTSENLYCVNCNAEFNVIRESCSNENCKGNVLYRDNDVEENICLTCYE